MENSITYKKLEFDLRLGGTWIPTGEVVPVCSRCNAFLPAGVKFCPECGNELKCGIKSVK